MKDCRRRVQKDEIEFQKKRKEGNLEDLDKKREREVCGVEATITVS
jgi:hypothetical protein